MSTPTRTRADDALAVGPDGVTSSRERAAELYREVLAPIVIGGRVRPVRPIGPALAVDLARDGAYDEGLTPVVEALRGRVARALAPLDRLPAPGRDEWLIAAAFNDLIQVANPHLPGLFGGLRPGRLLRSVTTTLAAVRAPGSALDLIARHATFARLFELARVDTDVQWWVGAATFRGEPPPARLLAWKGLRRVRVSEERVPLEDLVEHTGLARAPYVAALAAVLARLPLTDLATAARREPAFAWGPSILRVIATPLGARLARRALGPLGGAVDAALERAARALTSDGEIARVVRSFLDERRALSGAGG